MRQWIVRGACAGLLFAVGCPVPAAPQAGDGPGADSALARFYALRGGLPAWHGADGAATPLAHAAVDILARADREGLFPSEYAVAALAASLTRADGIGSAASDAAISRQLLRFLEHLHRGRSPDARLRYGDAVDPFDAAAALQQALEAGAPEQAVDAAAPPWPMYAQLRAALARYRGLAAQGDPPPPSLPPGRRSVRPGQAYAGAAQLAMRLRQLGDLDPGAAPAADRYDAVLAVAVTRFQQRHGLAADGVLGRATLAALAVPLAQRVHQIERAMEGLRWIPPLPAGLAVVVNIPSYRLWVLRLGAPGVQLLTDMRVIVGRAFHTPTPVFVAVLEYVEFHPYWNVPDSILRKELLPRLGRDPAIFARSGMELVGPDGVSRELSPAALRGLRAGSWRLRQPPGPDNALGAVKFGLPNAMNIYLHDTPSTGLFASDRRDFSHGCVRVEAPAALARLVLDDPVHWDDAAVAAAMGPQPRRIVVLKQPLPVLVFYSTVLARAGGEPSFLPDVYGHDAVLARSWPGGDGQ